MLEICLPNGGSVIRNSTEFFVQLAANIGLNLNPVEAFIVLKNAVMSSRLNSFHGQTCGRLC